MAVPDSMIRGIESGQVAVPLIRAGQLAAVFSRDTQTISAEAITRAYAAAAQYASPTYVPNPDRYGWLVTLGNEGENKEACDHLVVELTGRGYQNDVTGNRSGAIQDIVHSLNPIQITLVHRLAKAVHDFGTSIVSDTAIAEWEIFNADRLTSLFAVAPSLESELTREFQQALAKTVSATGVDNLRYLLLRSEHSRSEEFAEVCYELTQLVARSLSDQTGNNIKKCLSEVKRKLHFKVLPMVTTNQKIRDSLNLGSDLNSAWDGFYLYNVNDGQHLLIGIFRRLPANKDSVSPVTLKSWHAPIFNESLPLKHVQTFRVLFENLWKEGADPKSIRGPQ
ncbi:MAG TPA: hypothetical protein VKZ53_22940 [Candidatus Angelobacter sp.]|nr:hypothetical protein [Candidatus Angelobacter sp.]